MFPDRVHSPGGPDAEMLSVVPGMEPGRPPGKAHARHNFHFWPFFFHKSENPPKISFCLQRQILVFFSKSKVAF